MVDDNPNVQAVEVKSICFLCQHGQIMAVEQETKGVHPITGKPGTFTKHVFMVVCAAKGAFVFGPNVNVLSCSAFDQNEAGSKVLRAPVGAEVVDGTDKTQVN